MLDILPPGIIHGEHLPPNILPGGKYSGGKISETKGVKFHGGK